MTIARMKFEIEPLVNTMLDQIPIEVWKDPTTTFCDPAMGGGQFIFEIIRRLKEIGFKDNEIKPRVTGYEDNLLRVGYVAAKYFDMTGRVIPATLEKKSLDEIKEVLMKFDVIASNPPYQSSESTTKKLWASFVERMIEMTKENGYIAVVTPRAWIIRPESQLSSRMISKILKYQLVYVDLTAEKYFPSIGEKPCSYVVKKSPKSVETRFIFNDRIEMIDYDGQQIHLTDEDILKISIFKKVRNGGSIKMNTRSYWDLKADLRIEKMLELGIMASDPFEDSVPVFWTASQTDNYHVQKSSIRKGIKIICNISGYFYSTKYPTKYMLIDSSDSFAIGVSAVGISCSNMKEADSLISQLKSKLYRFYVDNEKTSGFNTGIGHLPILDLDRCWTDLEIYEHFNLTAEEIEYVESMVK